VLLDAPAFPDSDIWSMTAVLTIPSAVDLPEVRRALEILLSPGAHEIRGLPSGRSKEVNGKLIDSAVKSVMMLGDERGVYFTLNPVKPGLGDRAARTGDVLSRFWFLVDVDRKKTTEPDRMATDQEKSDALALAAQIADWLIAEGWPSPVIVDSGNGAHLLFRIDLPNNDLTRILLSKALKSLAKRWDNDRAEVDQKVFNAGRIAKLPGTWVRKGLNTPDRPWRLAKILWCPDRFDCVTVEQFEALTWEAKAHPDAEPTLSPWDMVYQAPPDRVNGYVKSGIARELTKLCLANPGERNNTLNAVSFALGQFCGAGVLTRTDAERQLYAAARGTGLGDQEIIGTVRSALNAGILKPHVLPTPGPAPKMNGVHAPAPKPTLAKLTIGLNEIIPRKVDWIYENRIAPGFITIFAGRTGLGKSFVTCDIVAKLSLGCPPAYSTLNHAPMRTLFMSEDSPEIVIGPRLLEMGADPTMVRFMTWEAMAQYTLADTTMLDQAYHECGKPRLIVIDPPANFLGSVDEHKNAEVRAVLKLLIAWLDTHKVACVFIMHINKAVGKGLEAIERIIGSVAWGSSARMTLAFTKDPNVAGQLLCGGTKNNLGPIADTLAYKVVTTPTLATVQWLGKVDTSMEDAMNSVKKKSRGECAVEWLTDRFREKREWESDVLKDDAANNGISKNALWSPEAQALPILKRQRINAAGDRAWYWIADVGWPPPEKQRESEESGKVNA
jgi:AAA domain